MLIRKLLVILPVVILLGMFLSCSREPAFVDKGSAVFGSETGFVQEVIFKSGQFMLYGDLRLPSQDGKYPAIILVHGSGSATRNGTVNFEPLIEIFLRNGFAVFSWDKPGSGESTGEFEGGKTLTQRTEILSDGIHCLTQHPNINSDNIGVWGVSQAGWVIPLALDHTDNIAFMIIVGGGGEDSIEQMAYQIGQKVICDGGTLQQAELAEKYWSQWTRATEYTDYKEALENLFAIPGVKEYTGMSITPEERWQPWPKDSDFFINPIDNLEGTKIPVLALYGKLDKNVDPLQGANAYEKTLSETGNTNYRVEIIPGAGHVLTPANTGCIGESGGINYVPSYLQILEEWIKQLNDT
ncbi:MAG: alpha/beta fold hydrolase [Dehalococcoidales bacterium]|nr:MAG: alpha/beta fold hydrolase [Dehalococcoidales bacterium]